MGITWKCRDCFWTQKKKIDNILDGLTQEKCYTPSRMFGWIGTR